MAIRLFAYGTLRKDRASGEVAGLVRVLRPLGKGVARGRLYDLGAYPAAIFDTSASTLIEGEVYEVPSLQVLRQLDAYEAFLPGNPAARLFLRRRRKIQIVEGGRDLMCWVYEYNRPLA
jgi:gamma-glutamylcyclotransferase (GGCT)/AIG2-like uncharacterized protein YtfP